MQVDVMLAGSVFCDLVFSGLVLPSPGTEVYADAFVVSPGGAANRAVAAARLGASTALVGQVGRDMFGNRVVEELSAEPGLDLRWLRRSDVHTPITVAVTDEKDRSFLTYEQAGGGIPDELPGPLPAVGVCNVGLARPVPSWVATLRRAGTQVVGGVGWDASQQWSGQVLEWLRQIDVCCVNDTEAVAYTRSDDPRAAARARRLRPDGGRDVWVDGVIAFDSTSGELWHVPAVRVDAIDPTGAGDVFMAGLMTATVLGWRLADALRLGTVAAALSVLSLGGAASAPRRTDVARFIEEHRPAGDWDVVSAWARTSEPEGRTS